MSSTGGPRTAPPPLPAVCPRCERIGAVGAPCPRTLCRRDEMHCIPAGHLPRGGVGLDPRAGRLLGGKYLIVEPIGAGGAGEVFLALQQPIGMRCALKLLRPESGLSSPARLFQEARALARIDHPNVVRLLDFGTSPQGAWLVMEYVAGGRTLRAVLKDGVEPGEGHRIVAAMAHGLQELHDHGLVHRDIKPGNVLLQAVAHRSAVVRLADFGLARTYGDDASTTVNAGTPRYMAPEQALKQPLGPWTDWYALGVVACEAMLGRHPFSRFDASEALIRKCRAGFDPVEALDMPLGPRTRAFLASIMARSPQARPEGLSAVLAGLSDMLAECRADRTARDEMPSHSGVCWRGTDGSRTFVPGRAEASVDGPTTRADDAPVPSDGPPPDASAPSEVHPRSPAGPEPAQAEADGPAEPPVVGSHRRRSPWLWLGALIAVGAVVGPRVIDRPAPPIFAASPATSNPPADAEPPRPPSTPSGASDPTTNQVTSVIDVAPPDPPKALHAKRPRRPRQPPTPGGGVGALDLEKAGPSLLRMTR